MRSQVALKALRHSHSFKSNAQKVNHVYSFPSLLLIHSTQRFLHEIEIWEALQHENILSGSFRFCYIFALTCTN